MHIDVYTHIYFSNHNYSKTHFFYIKPVIFWFAKKPYYD